MRDGVRIESTSLLAVEGADEVGFFDALLQAMEITGVQVVDIGGKDKFKPEFRLFSAMEGFRRVARLGIVRDAESLPARSAFDSVCGVLGQHRLPIPTEPGIILAGSPRVGVFVMPDNLHPGMLEDLCLESVGEHPLKPCVDDFMAQVRPLLTPEDAAKFNEPKARVQAYLAARVPLTNVLGLAARKHFWNLDHAALKPLRAFLRELFQ